MINKKVKKWVKEQQALGYSPKEIDDFLVKQGYPRDVADEATGAVSEPKAEPEPEPQPEQEEEPEPEPEPEDVGLGKLKPFGKPRFLRKLKFNRKAIPLILTGIIILIIVVGVVISFISKRGPETPDEPTEIPIVPDSSEGTELEDTQADEGTEPPLDEGTEPAPENEDLNECDAIGESAACSDGNSSTYDHCFENRTSGLLQCAYISDPIEGFDLEKARGLAIDASDLLDFCDKENVSNAEAYPGWRPGSVEIYNAEPPEACAVYVDRWCKGWLVECIVNQTRKIAPVYAMKMPFEDSYVVSEQQIAELPVEE